jgi:uncharacterized protein (TIGR03067 family)
MAMKRASQFVLLSSALVLALAGNCAGQARATHVDKIEGKTGGEPLQPTLVGPWRSDSVSMQMPDGGRKTLSGTVQPVSVIFSEKTCTLRLGIKVLAEMSYVLDVNPDPWTIDMKSKQGALLGICALKDNELRISLDDSAAGRPRDFDQEKHGMVLVLWRFRGTSLVVMNADGGNPHAILAMPDYTFVGSPKWSHDGSKIAFDAARKVMGENIKHVILDAEGVRPPRPFPNFPRERTCNNPCWSPDGKKVVMSAEPAGE